MDALTAFVMLTQDTVDQTTTLRRDNTVRENATRKNNMASNVRASFIRNTIMVMKSVGSTLEPWTMEFAIGVDTLQEPSANVLSMNLSAVETVRQKH